MSTYRASACRPLTVGEAVPNYVNVNNIHMGRTMAYTADYAAPRHGGPVAWLDQRGKPAWIAAMVVGFVVFWPVGLAILAFLIWSGRMGHCGRRGRWHFADTGESREERRRRRRERRRFGESSGNLAFDEYREETLKRLEDEQRDFESFLERLRMAKDKAEFDQFMADRRDNPPAPEAEPGDEAPKPQA